MSNPPTPFLLAALVLAACRSIPETEPGWSREELEVEVRVDPLISRLLRQDSDLASVGAVVSEAVFGLADVGLRFYPVPSGTYLEEHDHPRYHLTVHVQDLGAQLASGTARPAREKRPAGELESVRCTAVATLVKRRVGGPPLIVGLSIGRGTAKAQEASAKLSSMLEFELQPGDPFAIPPLLSSEELGASIREAVGAALRQLVEAIDREFGKRER